MSGPFILTMRCPDRAGIVAATTTCLAENDAFILETSHFADPETKRFFGRIGFEVENIDHLKRCFGPVADGLGMDWQVHEEAEKCRTLIMVSKADHCLNDLLYRHRKGSLNIDVTGVVSNHPDLKPLADWHEVPFHHFPITPETKKKQEEEVLNLFEETRSDLLVLARYMQVLTDETCATVKGRAINIHHSFLPGFKGAKPYHQAHERGVKLIGATAHFVTPDLDEGPIIEQEVTRVDHSDTPDDMVKMGRDLESLVLARAVDYFAEHRVLLNGKRTVVFR